MKKLSNKKGFTLVEIIVVLLILAIMAAVAIPTMLGFVNDARGKAEIANARAAYLACQMIATEDYADGTLNEIATGTQYTIDADAEGATGAAKRLNELLGDDIDGAKITPTITAGKVTTLVYINTAGTYQVTITPGAEAKSEKI